MAYGKGSSGSSGINAHKEMAGAGMSGNFGVSPHPGRAAKHPDVNMTHEPMADSFRSAPVGGRGGQMMQGAPDHGEGKGVKDHFNRGGMA